MFDNDTKMREELTESAHTEQSTNDSNNRTIESSQQPRSGEPTSEKKVAQSPRASVRHRAKSVEKTPIADETPSKEAQPQSSFASKEKESTPTHHQKEHDQQKTFSRDQQYNQHNQPRQQSGYRQQDHKQRDSRQQQGSYYNQQGEQKEQAKRGLEDLSLTELNLYARRLGIVGAGLMTKDRLIEKIKYVEANPEVELEVEGVLEKLPDGFGFLRSAEYDYVSSPDDVYVSPSQIRRFNLRTGDTVTGVIRRPKEGEKYFALLKINKVNNESPAAMSDRPHFDRLTPLHPNRKFILEYDPNAIATRIMDLFTPIGRGQRGLIVAPPKVGKTLLLKEIAQSLITGTPDAHLIILLVDERPEEVADIRKTVKGTSAQVISSTFDESAERHVQVAEIVLEKAKRLVESGKDVVILLDSITRLARAYNTNAPASGKVLTGGIDAHALQWPKRFFGAARATEEAGSLTIIATAMVDTGSRMDEVIYEEFKGTGNMEMHMTRKLSNRRTYPAFDLVMSSTRREDLLHSEEDLNKVWVLQKFLGTMNTIEGMEFLIDKMKKTKTNKEFLESINKKTTGSGS